MDSGVQGSHGEPRQAVARRQGPWSGNADCPASVRRLVTIAPLRRWIVGFVTKQSVCKPNEISALKVAPVLLNALHTTGAVSYTHLDVYKRQDQVMFTESIRVFKLIGEREFEEFSGRFCFEFSYVHAVKSWKPHFAGKLCRHALAK